MLNVKNVAVIKGLEGYEPPKKLLTEYPEYPHPQANPTTAIKTYARMRMIFQQLEFDLGNFGSKDWNPLGALVKPGDTVLIKPNLIRHSHASKPDEWEQVITSGELISAVIDFTFIALKGSGRILIADGPQTDSDFEEICQRLRIQELITFYQQRGLDISILDLRSDRWFQEGDVIYKRIKLPGDPAGYVRVDLDKNSEFIDYGLNGHFYGADYDTKETATFHSNGKHAYILCRSVVDADVIINLPKLKTHKKTGVTISLKNMVGINGYRNCLPHHTIGTPDQGGDEFPATDVKHKAQSQAIVAFKKVLVALGGEAGAWARWIKKIGKIIFGDTDQATRSGNWYGNDTAWRMVLDLNKALFYFQGENERRDNSLRYLTIVDGIIAGDGNGPSSPDPVYADLVVAGLNPLAVDTVCTTLMGFDYRKIPVIARGWEIKNLPLVHFSPEEIQCVSNVSEWNTTLPNLELANHLNFCPQSGWIGFIERTNHVSVDNRSGSTP